MRHIISLFALTAIGLVAVGLPANPAQAQGRATGAAISGTVSSVGTVFPVSAGGSDSIQPKIKRIPWQIGVFQ